MKDQEKNVSCSSLEDADIVLEESKSVKFEPVRTLKSSQGSAVLEFDEGDQAGEEFIKDLRKGTKFNFEALRQASDDSGFNDGNREENKKEDSPSSSSG